jgi:sugar phosphate permease
MPETRRKKVFYGWFALGGVMLVIGLVGGIFVDSYSVLLPIVTAEFGWSRATAALALSLGIMSFGLPSPLWGILVARLGPRVTLIWGNLIAGLGIAGVYFVQETWQLYVLYIIIGIGGGIGGFISCTTIINNWFIKKRSLALGIFTAFSGLGGLVFPPLTTALISAIGWRLTWLVLAGMIIVIAVLLGCVVLVRNRPEDMGLTPDGEPADSYTDVLAEETSTVSEKPAAKWRLTQVLKGPTVWLIGGFSAANNYTKGTMVTHQIAYLQDIGFNPMTAATTLSFMAAFIILGSLLFGTLALKVKITHLAVAAFLIQLAGLAIIILSRELVFIYIYAAFQGLSNGALTTAMPTIVGSYYSRERYSRVLGVAFPFQICANAIAGTVAGSIFDATGSYTPAFIAAAVFCFAGLIFVSMVRRPRLA